MIIGTRVRHADDATAAAAIAGYSVLNDVSVRDYQYRTLQWLQGKMFEHTTPLGPVARDRRRSTRAEPRDHAATSTVNRCSRPTPPTSCSTR